MNHLNHAAAIRLEIRHAEVPIRGTFWQSRCSSVHANKSAGLHGLVHKKPINPAISATSSITEKLRNCNKIVTCGDDRFRPKPFASNC